VSQATEKAGLEGVLILADHYKEPRRRQVVVSDEETEIDSDMLARMGRKTRRVFHEGPLEGSDRSSTLWKLANRLYEERTHDENEALAILRDADRRWGKRFEERPNGLKYLIDIVEKVFGVEPSNEDAREG
jgi:hypothetical protein